MNILNILYTEDLWVLTLICSSMFIGISICIFFEYTYGDINHRNNKTNNTNDNNTNNNNKTNDNTNDYNTNNNTNDYDNTNNNNNTNDNNTNDYNTNDNASNILNKRIQNCNKIYYYKNKSNRIVLTDLSKLKYNKYIIILNNNSCVGLKKKHQLEKILYMKKLSMTDLIKTNCRYNIPSQIGPMIYIVCLHNNLIRYN